MEDLNEQISKELDSGKIDELESDKLQTDLSKIENGDVENEANDIELEVTNANMENEITINDEQTDEDKSNAQPIDSTKLDILNQIISLQHSFNEKLKYDKHKQEIIDKLHEENQQYKKDIIKNVKKGILKDLMFLIDDVNKIISKYESEEEEKIDLEKLLRYFKEVPEEIEELLYKYDVLQSETKVGESFNPKYQKALKTEPTNDETKDKTIAAVLKNGYTWLDEKFRQTEVVVFKYKPAEDTDEIVKLTKAESNNNIST